MFFYQWLNRIFYNCIDETKREELFEELRSAYPEHLPLYLARLNALGNPNDKNSKAVVEAADTVLKQIDTEEILKYFGMKSDNRKDASNIKRYYIHTI